MMAQGPGTKAARADIAPLDPQLPEPSGMVAYQGSLWMHNDSGTAALFQVDPVRFAVLRKYPLPLPVHDWEELAQDGHFFYLGDFGNNAGERRRVLIYRILKSSLENDIKIDEIGVEWPDGDHPDCEAMVIQDGRILIFTKEYRKKIQTRVFSVPAEPGKHQPEQMAQWRGRMLVTGAVLDAKGRLVLCGYNLLLKPVLMVFDAFDGKSFDNGRKVRVRRHLRQVEAIATLNGTDYFLASEALHFALLKRSPEILRIELP